MNQTCLLKFTLRQAVIPEAKFKLDRNIRSAQYD